MSSMTPDTPCTKVCFIDPATDICLGCGRTLPEIANWHAMTRPDRLALMATLPRRMHDAGLPLPKVKSDRRTAD